jgi:hypothetical protein
VRLRTFAALAGAVLTAFTVLWFIRTADDPAEAANGNFRLFAPGLTNSSAFIPTPTPSPTPTQTPIGGGGGGGGNGPLEIYVSLDIIGQEPQADPDGMVDIPIFAAATADLPGPADAPVTVNGAVTVGPHPPDVAGCTYDRTYASTDFSMTVQPPQPGSTALSIRFEAPEWHYTVTCPTNPPFILRFPAFGEQQMLAFVGYTFPEFGPFMNMPIDVPEVSVAPDCIKRELNLHRTHQLADVTLRIVIYEPPCLLPLP